MFIPEIKSSLTISNRLWRILFINLDYCLLLKNASDWLELSIIVHTYLHADTGLCTSFNKVTYFKYSFNKCLEL